MLATKPSPAGATRPAKGARARAPLAPLTHFNAADLPLNERGEIDWRPESAALWTPAQRAAAFAEDDARMLIEAGSTFDGPRPCADALPRDAYVERARAELAAREWDRRHARGHFLDELDQNCWIPDGDDVMGDR